MKNSARLTYTLLLCLPTCLWLAGCNKSESDPYSSATTNSADMEIPTVQLPDDSAGTPDSSSSQEGSSGKTN
ncbi:MAG: hypothetical protein GY768_21750 [Planctomycetaceae bacterium]|nr:hypothetical protein [Planctomycetaceae bacterium]